MTRYITPEYAAWVEKENSRVSHEWDKWDGTPEQAEQVNDRQCKRVTEARARMVNGGFELGGG